MTRHTGRRAASTMRCFDWPRSTAADKLPGNFRRLLVRRHFAPGPARASVLSPRLCGCPLIDDPIATRPWGERSFYLRDPYGNRLCMVDQDTLFTG